MNVIFHQGLAFIINLAIIDKVKLGAFRYLSNGKVTIKTNDIITKKIRNSTEK
tara:strand:+ start:936 stop:1094 length:159 start_codon:yes stop_codon:yes gene_type:complete